MNDVSAARLRGFGPAGLLALLVIVAATLVYLPLGAALVLAWARLSGTPWREIGYVRPPSWARDLAIGIVLGVALKLVMKTVVMPLLGAEAVNQRYQFLVGNPAALPLMLFQVLVGAAWGEETVFRGWLFERLGRLFGGGGVAKVAIVVLTSVLFGLAHQGLPYIQQAVMGGLVFGTIYAIQRRIWPVMFVHAAFDLTAVAIIFWGLEERLAHLFFR